jgi:hypothetical protein
MLVGLVVTCDRDAGSGAFVGVAVTLPLCNLAIFGLTNPHQVPGTMLPLFRQLVHVFQSAEDFVGDRARCAPTNGRAVISLSPRMRP